MRDSIDPTANYWLSSSCGRVELKVPGELILDLAGPGPVDDAADYWVSALDWSGVDDAAMTEDLRESCADWEFEDADLNRARFLWLSSGYVYDSEAPDDHRAED